jgi:membrane fusion protein, multidrug efflux system
MANGTNRIGDLGNRSAGGRKRRLFWLAFAGALMFAVVAAGATWRHISAQAQQDAAKRPAPVLPVTVARVERRDVPVYLEALGTVLALNTVAIRAQVDGKLQSVNFVEGQEVHRGGTLAIIDPRPFQAALDQAVAKKEQDKAQLIAAEKDLARFKTLVVKSFETQQNVDLQQAKVDATKATIDADQAAIEGAETQLSYTTITAPIDGKVGFRLVDAGNIIHANDVTPLTVLTQVRPSVAVFTLPQKNLTDIYDATLRGPVQVLAFDQDNVRQLATGVLLLIDNQIDQTTSTIRLKAQFPNDDNRLWPGQFVRVRILAQTSKGALTMPTAAVQRGPLGQYTWVVKDDGTVDQRPIETTMINTDLSIATKGLSGGERVVINGQYRLQPGTRVDATSPASADAADRTRS